MSRLGASGTPIPQAVVQQQPAPVNQAPIAQTMPQIPDQMGGMARYGNPEAMAYGGGMSMQQSLARLLM